MVSQLEVPVLNANRSLHPAIEGSIQVFTCPHRSFFTNVMAQALTIAGQGTPVLVVQFLKGGIGQGHDHPVKLGQHLDWLRCNIPRCIDTPEVNEEQVTSLQELWNHTRRVINQEQYDLVVLDELSLAIHFELIDEAEVLTFLRDRPRRVDVILTGPDMPRSLLEIADQVTEMRRIHRL